MNVGEFPVEDALAYMGALEDALAAVGGVCAFFVHVRCGSSAVSNVPFILSSANTTPSAFVSPRLCMCVMLSVCLLVCRGVVVVSVSLSCRCCVS